MSQLEELTQVESTPAQGVQQEQRPWGSWKILDEGPGYKIKLIEVSPSHRLSLQYHHFRTEHWVVLSGRARIVIGDKYQDLDMLQSVIIPEGVVHRIENPFKEPLQIVEVQRGERLLEEDIVRLDDDYDRADRIARAYRAPITEGETA
ncbi:MAG: phosphomannose isomerase type II C-terminal cupin domain [Pseudomonadota bacterium]